MREDLKGLTLPDDELKQITGINNLSRLEDILNDIKEKNIIYENDRVKFYSPHLFTKVEFSTAIKRYVITRPSVITNCKLNEAIISRVMVCPPIVLLLSRFSDFFAEKLKLRQEMVENKMKQIKPQVEKKS